MSKEILINRNTVSNKIPEIDSLYVYRTHHKAKFTHRQQLGTGYRYMVKKSIMKAGEDEIHTYHRTVTIGGVSQGITMVTKNGKFRDVQKFFNEQIVAIEADDKLFDKFSKARSTPVELGLYYTYS